MYTITYITRTVHFDRSSTMTRETYAAAMRLFKTLTGDKFVASIRMTTATGRVVKKFDR